MKLVFPILFCLALISSCKEKMEFPAQVTYPVTFSDSFDSTANWTFYQLSFDANGLPNGHESIDFSFSNGLAEVRAIQDNQCARSVLDRHLENHSLIQNALENDTLFVTFTIDDVKHIEAGWSAMVIAVEDHVFSIFFNEIEAATTYTFEIADWEIHNYSVDGDQNATFRTEYSNEPEDLGTDKILLKTEACRGSNYAEARLVFDEISIKTKVTAI